MTEDDITKKFEVRVRPVDLDGFLVDFEHQWKLDGGNMNYDSKPAGYNLDVTKTHGTFDLTSVQDPFPKEKDGYRWFTAIQKVTPKSGSFWYEYGLRHDEKVLIVLSKERNLHGHRCCDVQVYTKRPVGDVVLSAWTEYNRFLVSAPK